MGSGGCFCADLFAGISRCILRAHRYVAICETLLSFCRQPLIAGYMNFVGVGIGLLVFPFGQQIVEKLGHINMLFVAILMQSTKLVIYSVVQ